MKRLKSDVLANGLNSFVSAVFNTLPNSCFGQNNCVIKLTGVASRYVGFVVALMLIVLGLFPVVSGFASTEPIRLPTQLGGEENDNPPPLPPDLSNIQVT